MARLYEWSNTKPWNEKNIIPENISFVRINSDTGKIDNNKDIDSYFELFLDENIKN